MGPIISATGAPKERSGAKDVLALGEVAAPAGGDALTGAPSGA